MIKAFFHSVFFCYDEIFRAETFLDLRLRKCVRQSDENADGELGAKLEDKILVSIF